MLRAIALTLFPEMFPGPLGQSLAGTALKKGIWSLEAINIRDFAEDKHKTVDDSPYGGGTGMVMRADVLGRAIEHAQARLPGTKLIYFTPRGAPLTQALAESLVYPLSRLREREAAPSQEPDAIGTGMGTAGLRHAEVASATQAGEGNLILICGRFEGIDERIIEHYKPLEISLGDFVLSGGEIPALALLDACVRLLPGVIGKESALDEESFKNSSLLLEYPHYTRPPLWKGLAVPGVLASGDHAAINAWRKLEAERATQARRPELMKKEQ